MDHAHTRGGTGKVGVPSDVLAGIDQSANNVVKIGYHDAGVPLAGRPEAVFDPEVQLDVACSEPRATARREDGRLVDLDHAEDADEEVTSGLLLSSRHCQLHVVEPIEGHPTDPASREAPAGAGSNTLTDQGPPAGRL